jgi:hypothetical protein
MKKTKTIVHTLILAQLFMCIIILIGCDVSTGGYYETNTQTPINSNTSDNKILPAITKITTNNPNGFIRANQQIQLQVYFNKVVSVLGVPYINLVTHRAGAKAYYAGGSGTQILSFIYTVVNGDNIDFFDFETSKPLQLNGGSITDAIGNEFSESTSLPGDTISISAQTQILLDTIDPSAPTNINDGIYLNSLSISPIITFTNGTDVGGSGILKNQIQIVLGSNPETIIMPWIDFISGSSVTGLTLSSNTQYKVQLKAIDNAGNESIATSDGWIADTITPSPPNTLTLQNPSSSPSVVTVPTVTIGGVTSGDTVNLYADNCINAIASGVSSGSSIQLTSSALNVGIYTLKSLAVDPAGNPSLCSTVSLNYEVAQLVALTYTVTSSSTSATHFPITFQIEFSNPVSPQTVDANAILQGGTAQGIVWLIVDQGNHKNFNLTAISALTEGIITPTIYAPPIRLFNGTSPTSVSLTSGSQVNYKIFPRQILYYPSTTLNYKEFGNPTIFGNYLVTYDNLKNLYFFNRSDLTFVTSITLAYPITKIVATGSQLIISDSLDDSVLTDSGKVYIYSFDGTNLNLDQSLKPGTLIASDYFGNSLAVSGTYMIVGAKHSIGSGYYQGELYCYEKIAGSWTLQHKLTKPIAGSNTTYFGEKIVMDDNILITSNYYQLNSSANLIQGEVYIYRRNVSTWQSELTIPGPNDYYSSYFGNILAYQQGTLLVGGTIAPLGLNASNIYVYKNEGNTWPLKATKNLNATGAFINNTSIFLKMDNGINLFSLQNTELIEKYNINADWPEASYYPERFGEKIVFDNQNFYVSYTMAPLNGNYIGAIIKYPYEENPPILHLGLQEQIGIRGLPIFIPVVVSGTSAYDTRIVWQTENGAASFPTDFTVSTGTLIIPAGVTTGSITILTTPPNHSQLVSDFSVKIVDQNNVNAKSTSTKIFLKDGHVEPTFNNSISATGKMITSGSYMLFRDETDSTKGTNAGKVSVYHHDGTNWVFDQNIFASDFAANRFFGTKTAMYGEYLAVTARVNSNWNSPMKVYIFHKVSGVWTEEKQITPSVSYTTDYFGRTLAMSEDVILIGRGYNASGSTPGALYIFTRTGTDWTQVSMIEPWASGYQEFASLISWDHLNNRVAVLIGGRYEVAFYSISGSTLTPVNTVALDQTGASFLNQLALEGDNCIVADPYNDSIGMNGGKIFILKYNGTTWQATGGLTGVAWQYGFGTMIQIFNSRLYILNYSEGGVYQEYRLISNSWTLSGTIGNDICHGSYCDSLNSDDQPQIWNGKLIIKGNNSGRGYSPFMTYTPFN